MFELFKQIGNLRRADKVAKALSNASSAIAAGQMEVADYQFEAAYKLCLETTFVRMNHIDLILQWGLIGEWLKKQGHIDLADRCFKIANLLQARFDAGDYYRNP